MPDHDQPEQASLLNRLLHPAAHANPDPGALADPDDDRDWDVTQHGRMRAHATDDEPRTETWEG